MLGETIKIIRTQHGLTQEELADKVGCKKQRICDIENGKGASTEMLDKIAEALKSDIMCVPRSSKYSKVMKAKYF
jgi:transcriptional regulator with XRE-family HTH domain